MMRSKADVKVRLIYRIVNQKQKKIMEKEETKRKRRYSLEETVTESVLCAAESVR